MILRLSRSARLIGAVLVIVLLVWVWSQLPVTRWLEELRFWIVSLGAVGVFVFIALYVLITVILGPASGLTLMAGFAYGAWGFPLVVFSATLAAAVAFLLGRHLAHERVNQWVNAQPQLQALSAAVTDESWRVVGLVRLSPIIPYGVQNYLFSVTDVGFVPFVLATLFGIMPATALFVYIGSLGQAIGTASTWQWALAVAGLVATALVAWVIGRRARAALQKQASMEKSED